MSFKQFYFIWHHFLAGDCRRGRAECISCPEGGFWRHQRVAGRAPTSVSADFDPGLGREELHYHLPATDWIVERLQEIG